MILNSKLASDRGKNKQPDFKLTPQQKLKKLEAMRNGQVDLPAKIIRSNLAPKKSPSLEQNNLFSSPMIGAITAIPAVSIIGAPVAYVIGLSAGTALAVSVGAGVVAGVLFFVNSK
jgi:hypothetical protein